MFKPLNPVKCQVFIIYFFQFKTFVLFGSDSGVNISEKDAGNLLLTKSYINEVAFSFNKSSNLRISKLPKVGSEWVHIYKAQDFFTAAPTPRGKKQPAPSGSGSPALLNWLGDFLFSLKNWLINGVSNFQDYRFYRKKL